MYKYLKIWCLPTAVAHIAVGKEHKQSHRMVAGITIMTVGVAIAKASDFLHIHEAHFMLDMVGYAVHGLGATPFIEHFMSD